MLNLIMGSPLVRSWPHLLWTEGCSSRVPTAQGKQGKWSKELPVRENTGNLEILPKRRENTENLVCPSCIFPDSKGKDISIFAAKISNNF